MPRTLAASSIESARVTLGWPPRLTWIHFSVAASIFVVDESIPLLRFLSFSVVQCMPYPTDVVIDYFAQPIGDA
jgi:hypothetical protein